MSNLATPSVEFMQENLFTPHSNYFLQGVPDHTWAILSMLWSFMTSLQVVPKRAAM